jgi:cbb3-type cytochrome oxidase maturation protein
MGVSKMSIIFLMIPMALLLGAAFVYGFFWSTSNGQLDDLETPAHRILNDDLVHINKQRKEQQHES